MESMPFAKLRRVYNQSRERQVAALKQQIETATGVEKEGL